MVKTRHCERCDRATRQEISRRGAANGVEHFGWWCRECQWWMKNKTGGIWIDKATLERNGVDLSLAPVAERIDQPRCARCGTRGAEEHHWAPRALFGKDEADKWPKDFLCKRCHDKWHLLVTPALARGDEF